MEQRIIMRQAEIDALWETWGMGDYDRAMQNIELERRRLGALLAAANELADKERHALIVEGRKWQERAEENARAFDNLVVAFRVNILRLRPQTTHEEITTIINVARNGEPKP